MLKHREKQSYNRNRQIYWKSKLLARDFTFLVDIYLKIIAVTFNTRLLMATLLKGSWVKGADGGRLTAGCALSPITPWVRRSSALYSSRHPPPPSFSLSLSHSLILSLSASSLLLAPLGGDEPLQLGPHTNFHRYQVATINRFWNQVSCDLQFFPLTNKASAPLRTRRGPQMSSFSTVTYSILLPADQETIYAA